MGFELLVAWIHYRYIDNTFATDFNRPHDELFWSVMASVFFRLFIEAPMPMEFGDSPLLVQRGPAPSAMATAAMDNSFSFLLHIGSRLCADPDHPFLPAAFRPFSLPSPYLPAMKISVPDIALDRVLGNGITVEYLMCMLSAKEVGHALKLKDFSSTLLHYSVEVHDRQRRALQQNEYVRNLIRQVRELSDQLQD